VRLAISERHAPDPVENMRHWKRIAEAAYVLARLDGEPVGWGMAMVFPGADRRYPSGDLGAIHSFRERGVGTALLRDVSAKVRGLGGEGLQVEVREDDESSILFAERRGFAEIERQKEVALDLGGDPGPPPASPHGITIVSRAERPDLARGQYEVELAAGRDIPGLDAEVEQTYEEWHSFAIERPGADPSLCFLAVDGRRVVGSAAMLVVGDCGYHGLTAVDRDWRGRGIAEALKRSQIAAARAHGLTKLFTESQHDNVPMRSLNEKLGYVPAPGVIVFRGPLLD